MSLVIRSAFAVTLFAGSLSAVYVAASPDQSALIRQYCGIAPEDPALAPAVARLVGNGDIDCARVPESAREKVAEPTKGA